jgi:hypothetical protein
MTEIGTKTCGHQPVTRRNENVNRPESDILRPFPKQIARLYPGFGATER